MGWETVIGSLSLVVVGVVIVGLSLWRSDRTLTVGDAMRATVKYIDPGGSNPYPPYGSWGPSLGVTYERGGKVRQKKLWLEATKAEDYYIGQQLVVFVSRRWPHHLRTKADANTYTLVGVGIAVGFGGVIYFVATAFLS